MSEEKRLSIKFGFSPNKVYDGNYAVEKSDTSGNKRRYVAGIASGSKLDLVGERMTPNCIKSFMAQANSGDLLLYPDIHGIRSTQDIGILTKAEILPDGDWNTEYRLYDDFDDVDDASKQIAKKEWNQMNGLPPYKNPRQKGFSIEGFIPEGKIIQARKDEHGNLINRVIDDIYLDGVVLVPRPAYKDSIANAVYKALGEITPMRTESIIKVAKDLFSKTLENSNIENEYFRRKWELGDALESAIETVMKSSTQMKDKELEVIFDVYKQTIIPLILKSEPRFHAEASGTVIGPYGPESNRSSRVDVLKALVCEMEKLSKTIPGGYNV
jgi:hypothetical protein